MELVFKLKIDFDFYATLRGLVKGVGEGANSPGASSLRTMKMESLPMLVPLQGEDTDP